MSRCWGDYHKPDCAHLGLDPTRKRCRGDKHRSGCRHLHPRSVGRPRRTLGRPPLIPPIPPKGYPSMAEGKVEHEIPPLIPPISVHRPGGYWEHTSCLCQCHYWAPRVCDVAECRVWRIQSGREGAA